MSEEAQKRTASSVDKLSDTIESTIAQIANKMGNSVEGITNAMVGSAGSVSDMAQQQVKAATGLAQTRAAFRFRQNLEDAAMDHLEEMGQRRLQLEIKIKDCPEGSPTRRFMEASLEKLNTQEEALMSQAMNIEKLLEIGSGQQPPRRANRPQVAGALSVKGDAFAPPGSHEDVEVEITTDPVIMDEDTQEDNRPSGFGNHINSGMGAASSGN